MPGEHDQQVTVRLLPDGDAHSAVLRGLSGQLLQIDVSSVPPTLSLKSGDLVEVASPGTLYLGEVRSCLDHTTFVGIEHSLDREALALIRQVWHGPADY
jgi:hypothetical protein